MESEEEDDPVVDEVDVFLAKDLSEKLYMFQYPVRPASLPYSNQQHLAARIKPKQKKVELDVSIDTASPSYSQSKGQQIALNVDGSDASGDNYFNSRQMDKQTFSSSNAAASTARYAVGVLREGELHLTPLHGIIQLRPNFKYLDRADTKVKQQGSQNADADLSQDEADKEEDIKPIKVQLIRQESDQAKARRMASFAYHQEKMEEEKWIECNYIHEKDALSDREKVGLYCRDVDHEISQLTMLPKEYLTKLIPEYSEGDSAQAQLPNNVLSISQLKTLPLIDQVRALLTNAKVLKYSQLMQILPGSPDPAAVLKAVQQVAVLVQGCWVVKSEILYPKDSKSPTTGVSAEILCRGRNYLMWRFTQSRCVVRKEIASIIKLMSEDMKEILEQMARPKVNQGWEFCEPYDAEFVKKHPEIVQRQDMIWNAMFQKLADHLKLPKVDEKKQKGKKKDGVELMEVVTGEERVKNARKRAKSISQSSSKGTNNPMSTHNATEINSIDNDGKDSSNMHEPMDTSDHNHVESLDVNHHGFKEQPIRTPVSNTKGDEKQNNDLKDSLTSFLSKKFCEQVVMSIPDMRKFLNIRLMESTLDDVLKGGISDSMLVECALRAGAMPLDIAWPTDDNSVTEKKLYGMRTIGDVFDLYRGSLMDLFQETFRIRKTTLEEKIREIKEPASKAEMERIIRCSCIHKGHWWYLKGTLPTT